MSEHEFLKPRLTGRRFEGTAIPLEFLKDLAVLEEMIIEVAKGEFLKEHPDRQRSPRGFTDGIELKLTGIEDGSAIPVISLVVASMTLFPPENQSYFERARDSIVSAVDAAEKGGIITDHLPEKSLNYFDRMGRSLRQGEAMEFTTPAHTQPAKLTRETRRQLVYASSAAREMAEETSVRGSIPEADQDDMQFEIQMADGRKVKAPIAPQHRDTILEAFKGYQTGQKVLIQGVGVVNRNGKLVRFDSIEHVSPLDPLDVGARIDEIRLLKDGWLEGGGKAPAKDGLDWLEEAFSLHYPDEIVPPYLYPTPEGGIRAEWSNDRVEVSMDIQLTTKRAAWHALDLETDDEENRDLNLDEDAEWAWLVDKVQGTMGGAA